MAQQYMSSGCQNQVLPVYLTEKVLNIAVSSLLHQGCGDPYKTSRSTTGKSLEDRRICMLHSATEN